MNTTWYLLDGNFLCHRALHSYGKRGLRDPVVYGFLMTVRSLRLQLGARLVFCWDHGEGLRKRACPHYKASRGLPEPTFEAHLTRLKCQILDDLGYRNVFWRAGYEADDVIAAVCDALPPNDHKLLTSADRDLYQLIGPKVSVWNPISKHTLGEQWFREQFGIYPAQWPAVKALAGCKSDEVPGLGGVAEKTACAFLRYEQGDLPECRLSKDKVEKCRAFAATDRYRLNKQLVTLPYPGVGGFKLHRDDATHDRWNKTVRLLGMPSLLIRESSDG